jgi:CRP/FNR family cyclic AMP-dependent transcriptional regulator
VSADPIRQFLAKHPHFGSLDAAQLDDVARRASLRRLMRGEVLALEGDPCTAVYLVMEGRIYAFKISPQGREQVVNELQSGQVFYLVPALDNGPLPTTTQAATRATVIVFGREDFADLLHRYPSLSVHLLTAMAERLRRLSTLVEDLSLRSVSQRLARLLVGQVESPGRHRMTQREMAAQLGTVREVVARSLSQFESQGWIRVRRGAIEIIDLEALREESCA